VVTGTASESREGGDSPEEGAAASRQ
jgi:hypothetical protein